MAEFQKIQSDMTIKTVVTEYPDTIRVFAKHGLGCATCHIAGLDTVEKGARAHKIKLEPLLADLNLVLENPAAFPEIEVGGLLPSTPGSEFETTGLIKNVVAIVSGKGGVGKSYVTSMLAVGLNRMGKKVGILDADVTGPSIPRTFGILARPALQDNGKIIPVISSQGIKIMSSLFFVADEDEAVIWRGPLITRMIRDNFYNNTLWGELDYLLVDLPPGTSDAPLTVMQSLDVKGIILVSSPQLLATSIVRKAIRMADKMHTPILGVAENMSWFVMPGSDKKLELFGTSQGEELATSANAPLMGRLPLDPQARLLIDEGRVEDYHSIETDELVQNFLKYAEPQMKKRTLVIRDTTEPAKD
jgi:hybrid cluster-associated redox disulfide protein